MFSHVILGANDLEASKNFYNAALATLGIGEPAADPKGRYFYRTKTGVFGITNPIDGEPATHGNGFTLGFAADSPEAVDAWHKYSLGVEKLNDPSSSLASDFSSSSSTHDSKACATSSMETPNSMGSKAHEERYKSGMALTNTSQTM